MDKEPIIDNWNDIWRKSTNIPEWDYLSQIIFRILCYEIGIIDKLKIGEMGCGTGRISLKLAKKGADVVLLDNSPNALEISKKFFRKAAVPIHFCQASLFNIPIGDSYFDIIWNAGVLEHFSQEKQLTALAEMARVCRKGGIIITINPNSRAILYRFGKWATEKIGSWPYGPETPIKTLRASCQRAGLVLTKEYSRGFFLILVESFRFLPFGKKITFFLRNLFLKIGDGVIIKKLDAFLSSILGGYLLVTVCKNS